MKRQFRSGSIVKLKSGGLDMTVIKYEMQTLPGDMTSTAISSPAIQTLVCVTWFEYGKWKSGRFDPDLLVLVK